MPKAKHSEAASAKFRFKKMHPGAYNWRGVGFDTRSMSLKQANTLFKMGARFLTLKKVPADDTQAKE